MLQRTRKLITPKFYKTFNFLNARNYSENISSFEQLLNSRKPWFGLSREFYTNEDIFRLDLKKVWHQNWLFAGHSCTIRNPGDYFLFELDNDSLIIIRDDDNKLHALHNTCRHRGSILCHEKRGRMNRLVCPYHQWVYSKNGTLEFTTGMENNFSKSEYGLHKSFVEELEGLIFVHLGKEPNDFNECREYVAKHLKPQRLNDAKIAMQRDYIVNANWKIIYENNRECLHCRKGHPGKFFYSYINSLIKEYITANYDLSFTYNEKPDGSRVRELDPRLSKEKRAEILEQQKWALDRWRELQLPEIDTTQTTFPGQGWYKISRVFLKKGWFTEVII